MASIKREITINASPDKVWKLAGDFAGIAEWHPAIDSAKMVEGEKEPRRILTLADGGIVDERLVELNDAERTHTYIILDSPIPFTNYRATIRVQAFLEKRLERKRGIRGASAPRKPKGGQSRVIWSATYDPNPGEEATCVKIVSGVFESGLAALKERLEG